MLNLSSRTRAAVKAVKGIDWCLVVVWIGSMVLIWSGGALLSLLAFKR